MSRKAEKFGKPRPYWERTPTKERLAAEERRRQDRARLTAYLKAFHAINRAEIGTTEAAVRDRFSFDGHDPFRHVLNEVGLFAYMGIKIIEPYLADIKKTERARKARERQLKRQRKGKTT